MMGPSREHVLSTVRSRALAELDNTFFRPRLGDMIEITEAVEARIRGRVAEEIARWCASVPGFQVDERRATHFWRDTALFEVIAHDSDPHKPWVLDVTIVSRSHAPGTRRPRPVTVDQPSVGRYQKVRAYIAPELERETQIIVGIVQVILVTSYRWLSERFSAAAAEEENAMAAELYSTLRVLLPDPRLNRHVWFSTYDGQHGYYLVDQIGVATVLDSFHGEVPFAPGGSARLASEFMTDVISYALTNAKIAIERGECCDFDLMASRYARSKNMLVNAQRFVVDAEVVSILPLKREGKFLLAAVFPGLPQDRRQLILQALLVHRAELVQRFDRYYRSFGRMRNALRRPMGGNRAGYWGQFVGGMMKGYFGDP